LKGHRSKFDRFRVLAAVEVEGRAAGETELVRAIDVIVGQRGVVARQHVPIKFQEELVIFDDRRLISRSAWVKPILALSDIDDVLHGGEIELRSIPDDRDKGAPLFITDKEKE